MRRLLNIAAAGILATAGWAVAAQAGDKPAGVELAQAKFDAAKHFAGRTIRVIVGFRPGGGTDLQARHFAAHWGEYIPGHPRMQVTNITPNTTAANRLYASEPDGLTLEMTAGSNVVNQFSDAGAKFKIDEDRIIGTHTGSSSMMFARKGLAYKTMKDAIGGKTVIRVGARSPTDAYAMRLAALSEWLKIPIKFIPGLSGTTDNLIALERGDIDGYLPGGGGTVWYSLPRIRPGWLKNGTVRAFALMGPSEEKVGTNSEGVSPDAPRAIDLISDPKRKRLFEILARADTKYGKVWMAPPKTPDAIINVLRKSYEAVLNDKAFRSKLEEMMGEPVEYTPGDEVEKDLKDLVKGYGESAKEYEQWAKWAKARF